MTLRRTLQRSLSTTTRGLLQFGSGGVAPSYDTDAQAYITAVEAADSQSLETGVKDAINAFVVGCKADGIWTAIKASCILSGARTLTGALVPLVGTAPTNNNFVSGDYSRTAGLAGNGSTKYLDSNTAHNVAPQNDAHVSIYMSNSPSTGNRSEIYVNSGSLTNIGQDTFPSPNTWYIHDVGSSVPRFTDSGTGFKAVQRSNASNFNRRTGATTTNVTRSASATAPSTGTFTVMGRTGGVNCSDSTLAFYSIGESLDLALLDSRVTTLITSIGTALA